MSFLCLELTRFLCFFEDLAAAFWLGSLVLEDLKGFPFSRCRLWEGGMKILGISRGRKLELAWINRSFLLQILFFLGIS